MLISRFRNSSLECSRGVVCNHLATSGPPSSTLSILGRGQHFDDSGDLPWGLRGPDWGDIVRWWFKVGCRGLIAVANTRLLDIKELKAKMSDWKTDRCRIIAKSKRRRLANWQLQNGYQNTVIPRILISPHKEGPAYIYIYTSVYILIYIERERERETYMCTYIYQQVYIFIHKNE